MSDYKSDRELNPDEYTVIGFSKTGKFIVSKRISSGKAFYQIWKLIKKRSFDHHIIICGGFNVNEINKLWLDEYKAA